MIVMERDDRDDRDDRDVTSCDVTIVVRAPWFVIWDA